MTVVDIGFLGRSVAVRSTDAGGVLAQVARSFERMPARAGDERIAELRVERAGRNYEVLGPQARELGATVAAAARRVRYAVIELLMEAHPDLIWLHGAAAGLNGRAVILPGRRGRGKSTLVTRLARRGWSFLTDDILPFDPDARAVHPFPQLAAVRRDPGRDLPDEEVGDLQKDERPADRVADAPLPVGAVVLPAAQRVGQTTLAPCGRAAAALELVQGCWNLPSRGTTAVGPLTGLVASAPVARLSFADADRAADLLEGWTRAGWPDLGSGGFTGQGPVV